MCAPVQNDATPDAVIIFHLILWRVQGSTSPAAPSAASPANDPFAPKPQASAASRQEAPSSPGDPFAESQGAQQPPPKEPVAAAPAPKKSAADILKMFDAPMQVGPLNLL